MNSLDQLIHQSKILLEIIDELLISIRKATDKENLSKTEMCFLNDTINRTVAVTKSFIKNYNEFLTNQIDIEFNIEIQS